MNLRQSLGRGGFVAAACVACCAPPIIASLGLAAGLAATVGVFLGITAAIAVALIASTAIAAWSRRRKTCATDGPTPVSISSTGPGR